MERIIRHKVTPLNVPLLVFDIMASYGFTIIILALLLLLTFLGTLAQAEQGLFGAQEKYFNSLWLVHYFFGVIPVPLPVQDAGVAFSDDLLVGTAPPTAADPMPAPPSLFNKPPAPAPP